MNSFAMAKLMSPQPGKVNIQVSIMSETTPKLMAERRLTDPTPMIALVLVCVVETGMPKRLESKRQPAAARSGSSGQTLPGSRPRPACSPYS